MITLTPAIFRAPWWLDSTRLDSKRLDFPRFDGVQCMSSSEVKGKFRKVGAKAARKSRSIAKPGPVEESRYIENPSRIEIPGPPLLASGWERPKDISSSPLLRKEKTENPPFSGEEGNSYSSPGPPLLLPSWQRPKDIPSSPLLRTETTENPPLSGGEDNCSSSLGDTGYGNPGLGDGASPPDQNGQLLTAYDLAALRADPVRSRLVKKLSEANLYNRHLHRELKEREDAIRGCRYQISALELELGTLAQIAREIAKDGGRPGTRKINGRYIHSHLAVKLEDLQRSLSGQIKDIDTVRCREIEFSWSGMAEDVTVMGSFDNWTRGASMSPESTGTLTRFSVTLKLRPGRYEIKFRVDGDWRLSPELPSVGEGLMANNLLIVE